MTNPTDGVQIHRVHADAICAEIGERLRFTPIGKPGRFPMDLLRLIERLEKVELGAAPSAKPSARLSA